MYVERLNNFKTSQIALFIVVGSLSGLLVLTEALSASSSINNNGKSILSPI